MPLGPWLKLGICPTGVCVLLLAKYQYSQPVTQGHKLNRTRTFDMVTGWPMFADTVPCCTAYQARGLNVDPSREKKNLNIPARYINAKP